MEVHELTFFDFALKDKEPEKFQLKRNDKLESGYLSIEDQCRVAGDIFIRKLSYVPSYEVPDFIQHHYEKYKYNKVKFLEQVIFILNEWVEHYRTDWKAVPFANSLELFTREIRSPSLYVKVNLALEVLHNRNKMDSKNQEISKIQWTASVIDLCKMFKDLIDGDSPKIVTTKANLTRLLLTFFIDKNGEELKKHTIESYFKPN